MKTVFEYNNYKRFMTDTENIRRGYERGFRSKVAAAIGCQSGYISHVLNGDAQFSLEQALMAAQFLGIKGPEQKYFLLLVELERAGTRELKAHFAEELKSLKEHHLNIKERVGTATFLSEKDQSQYYSSWHFLAVHVLTSLQKFSDAKAIAQALRIPEGAVGKVLLFLIQARILKESKGILTPGLTQVHLDRESPLIRQHHTNWRIAAIQSLVNEDNSDLHYSTVSTLSRADVEKLRAEMIQLIEHYVGTVRSSNEETMYGFNLDFYGLLKT